ncbi:hypothetical protein [Ramlibacter tataouinensis]|uniref:Uncharacterized protein n=1 Tax=Ramlibacter tataouinensis (strain ATCC BAA-407 / DSM 14655 / LMG 21543 / TTB310) TaxID=365046 RepID=F5XXC9_RAMTT|nr:hypothetical protein [Ramlibacter tataouinensis]AEG94264.1 conserved hypothetical protein [Ramlibacter tataouinensis TTB310]
MKRRLRLEHAVLALLVAWACGLAVAAVRLDAWRHELSRTLIQLRADTLFRANMARERDKIQPAWYRQKALSLISALERMRHDAAWTLFMPGSWHVFDDLEERLAGHIGEAFGHTVVDTVHRELYARAAVLTGVPQDAVTAQLQVGRGCTAPGARAATGRHANATPEDMPEYAALTQYLAQAEALDRAVQALTRLQSPATAKPEDVQMLVRYALQAELPGEVSRSIALFHSMAGREGRAAHDLATRIQWATRCSLGSGMAALHARLMTGNELLSLETELAQAGAGLFDPAHRAAPASPEAVLVRYHQVSALLQRQEALLAQGRHEWMQQDAMQLGPGYQRLVERIAAIGLLGPQAAAQVQAEADRAFVQFRQRFNALFGRPGSGIVWLPGERRFALSPERQALREGFSVLLREPSMALPRGAAPGTEPRRTTVAATVAVAAPSAFGPGDVQEMLEARKRLLREALPVFPPRARASVARFVNARVAQVAYERAALALAPPAGEAALGPLDSSAVAMQRDRAAALQALLQELGAPGLAQQLRDTLGREQLRRIASAEDSLRGLPLFNARSFDFSWWQGESGPLLRVFNAPNGEALQRFVPEQVGRLERLGGQAAQMLASTDPSMAADPAAQRWAPLLGELQRYRNRQADSSLVALESYLAAVGGDLRRDNCLERLVAQPAPQPRDEIGRRHAQLHRGLVARCLQLRQSGTPAL